MTPRQLVDLIARSGNPAKELKAIDYYIQLKGKALKRFALPEQDAHLLPIIDYLGFDLEKQRAFAKMVRNEVERVHGTGSSYYANCYEVTRVLDVRAAGRKIRMYLQPALQWAKMNMPERTVAERERWKVELGRQWSRQRAALLKEAKDKKGSPISVQEKEEILEQFWNEIGRQVANGELPSWEDLMGDN